MARKPAATTKRRSSARREVAPRPACGHAGAAPAAACGAFRVRYTTCPQCLRDLARAAHGVAHELNNAVSVCQGNLELLRAELAGGDCREMVEDALVAVSRLARMVGDFSAVAHTQPFNPAVFDPGAFLRARLQRWRSRLPEGWRLDPPASAPLPDVNTDPDYLGLALSALLANATAVVAAGGAVRLRCSLRRLPADLRAPLTAAKRDHVVFEVGDSGPALDGGALASAFEPGCVLRPGATAGMGLWFARLFADVSGGYIWVERNAPDELCIALALPAVAD